MKKKTNTELFHELEDEIKKYDNNILKNYPQYKILYSCNTHLSGIPVNEWEVTSISVSYIDGNNMTIFYPKIKDKFRYSKKDIEILQDYFDKIKKAKYEIWYYLYSKQKYVDLKGEISYGTCKCGIKYTQINNKDYSPNKQDCLNYKYQFENEQRELKKKYYEYKKGYAPCDYCMKQVPTDKLIHRTIISRARIQGIMKVVSQEMNFCSGACAYYMQCSLEG